jgi:cytochrome c-type biogenesis protein CcmE
VAVTLRPRPRSRTRLWLAGGAVVVAVGFLLSRGLGDATVYFYTADEAVAKRASLGTHRFRIEGVVVGGSVRSTGDGVAFAIEENGVRARVRHQGDPPELFQPDIPVVLEGRWDGDVFASDRIMVRHTSEYRAEHPERVGTAGP